LVVVSDVTASVIDEDSDVVPSAEVLIETESLTLSDNVGQCDTVDVNRQDTTATAGVWPLQFIPEVVTSDALTPMTVFDTPPLHTTNQRRPTAAPSTATATAPGATTTLPLTGLEATDANVIKLLVMNEKFTSAAQPRDDTTFPSTASTDVSLSVHVPLYSVHRNAIGYVVPLNTFDDTTYAEPPDIDTVFAFPLEYWCPHSCRIPYAVALIRLHERLSADAPLIVIEEEAIDDK
jgi:hypothetical protein